jgi:hypothetical protein
MWAVAAAVTVARQFGVRSTSPSVLADGSNVLVHLRPAPVVARVASLTAMVRPGVEDWVARDISISTYLASRGIPVVRPSVDPPAGPHHHNGRVLAFFEYVPHDRSYRPSPEVFGRQLAELHDALREYPGALPALGPVNDLRRGLDLLERHGLGAVDEPRATLEELAPEVDKLPPQALHGDAHPGNLLAGSDGLVWNDFEDAWWGPLGWDLACLAHSARLDGWAAVRAYPGSPPLPEIELCLRLRRLYAACWEVAVKAWGPRRTGEDTGQGR